MKKKQLFAVLLAGSMTVGMAPAAAFAAEDTGAAAAEAQAAEENTGAADGTEFDAQTNVDGADSQQEDTDGQADAQTDTDAGAQAAADAEAQAAAEAQAQAEAEAQAQAEAAQQQLEQEQAAAAAETAEQGTVVKSEEELQKVINEAPELSDTTNVQESDLTKIIISGTIPFTNTVTIPANKGIAIVGEDENAKIERADSYAGNLFEVNGILYMAKRDVAEGAGTLSVDGSVEGETQVTGSLVHVASGAKFAMTTGITLTNNTTTARGAAIFNEGGTVQITGGQISNNHSDGGAVYSTGMILVKKGDGAADTEPTITGNTKTDGQTAANVVLAGTDGKIVVNGEITSPQIGFSVENAAENYVAIAKSEDVTDEAFKAALGVLAPHYEGDKNFKVDTTTGVLVSNRPTVKITGSTWENGSTTATATITSDKAGTYYYKWVAKGAAAPSIDDATEGVAIAAGRNSKRFS